MRPGYLQEFARLGTGVLVFLVCYGVCASRSAQAGCGHLVTSRADRASLPSQIARLTSDSVGRPDSSQASTPPRPCSGAWCSEQPATPTAPLSSFDSQVDPWAWYNNVLPSITNRDSRLTIDTVPLHAVHEASVVFHPPRALRRLKTPILATARAADPICARLRPAPGRMSSYARRMENGPLVPREVRLSVAI